MANNFLTIIKFPQIRKVENPEKFVTAEAVEEYVQLDTGL